MIRNKIYGKRRWYEYVLVTAIALSAGYLADRSLVPVPTAVRCDQMWEEMDWSPALNAELDHLHTMTHKTETTLHCTGDFNSRLVTFPANQILIKRFDSSNRQARRLTE